MSYRNLLAEAVANFDALPATPQRDGASLTMPSPYFQPAVPTRLSMLARMRGDPIAPQQEEQRAWNFANLMTGFGGGAAPRVYHGSPRTNLTELVPGERGPFGPATYLSPSRQTAEQYARGGRVYELDYPREIFHGAGRSWLPDNTVNPFQLWRDQTARLVSAAPQDLRAAIAASAHRQGADGGYQFYYDLMRQLRSETAPQDLFRQAGFRGISGMVDGPEIAMFGRVLVR